MLFKKSLVELLIQINSLLEENNLKCALKLFKNYQKKDLNPKKIHKIKILLEKFNEDFENKINKKSHELFIKNIKNIFEGLPNFAWVVKSNLLNPSSTLNFDYFGSLSLFNETKEIFVLMGKMEQLEILFYEKFNEFISNALIKNITSKNFIDKSLEFFCFFATYKKFNHEIFNKNLKEIDILKLEPLFISKTTTKIKDIEYQEVSKLIILLIKLGNLFDICGLEGPFIIFQQILEFSINTYVEKGVSNLHLKLQKNIQLLKNEDIFKKIKIQSLEKYEELISFGFILDEQSHMVNCVKYLKETFKAQESWILNIFYFYAKMIQEFVAFFDKDLQLDKRFKSIEKYCCYGVEFINKLLLNDIKNYLEIIDFELEKLGFIYFNVIKFKKNVLKKYLTEQFYVHRDLINNYDVCQNLIYEKLISKIEKDIHKYYLVFAQISLGSKSKLQEKAEYFENIINPFKVL